MSDNKTYHIDSWEKLCNVINDENKTRLLIDLSHYFLYYAATMKEYRDKHPEQTEGKTNTEIAKSVFKWTDDGVEGINSFEVMNMSTGEVVKHKIKK